MQIWFIGSLLFAILVAFFAVMNSDPVSIKWFWGKYEFSQAIVIFGSAALGAIIVTFLGIFRQIRLSLKIRDLQSKVKKLEDEKGDLTSQIDRMKAESEQMDNEKTLTDNTQIEQVKNMQETGKE